MMEHENITEVMCSSCKFNFYFKLIGNSCCGEKYHTKVIIKINIYTQSIFWYDITKVNILRHIKDPKI